MKVIETKVVVAPDGTATVQLPPDVPPGGHPAVLVMDDYTVPVIRRSPLRFSAYPVGLARQGLTFRREDLYGDDGR